MTSKEKEKAFFEIAKKMNERFAIIPLLFGSVALNMLVDEDVWTGDIDIAIPHYFRPDRKWLCPDVVKLMEEIGYQFTDMHEGEFHRGEIMVHIAGDNIFKEYANIDVMECPIIHTNGAIYKLSTPEHHVKSYTVTAEQYRRDGVTDEDINHVLNKADIARKAHERRS